MIEVLLVLIFVLVLHILASGFELSISTTELIGWAVGGTVVALWVSRAFVGRVAETWMAGPRRTRGPAAEGLARLRKGDLPEAEVLLRRCLERYPSDPEALRGLAEIAFRHSNYERYLQLTSQVLGLREALRDGERVALCHRQADVCLGQLNDARRAIEALARIELDYAGTADAARARQRIERILSQSATEDR